MDAPIIVTIIPKYKAFYAKFILEPLSIVWLLPFPDLDPPFLLSFRPLLCHPSGG